MWPSRGRPTVAACSRSSATTSSLDQTVFVGVISPIDPRVETPQEVCDRVLEAAEYIPVAQLGTCDDCGFSPFCDDTTTTRETAFAKIRARVLGTALGQRTAAGELMADERDEEARLREVALQNAQSILAARRRAEDALRQQSEWLRVTLASIGDARDYDGRRGARDLPERRRTVPDRLVSDRRPGTSADRRVPNRP